MLNLFDFDMSKTTFEVINAFGYAPKVFDYSNTNGRRQYSGFLYIVKGKYKYSYEGRGFVAGDNSLVYIPPRAKPYFYQIVSDDTNILWSMQIEIDIMDADAKVPIAFSQYPVLITKSAPPQTREVFNEIILTKSKTDVVSKLMLHGEICRLLTVFSEAYSNCGTLSINHRTISPALQYIQENYKKDFSVSKLARICNVSETHLRRIFKDEFGMSPIKYRNKMILQEACSLLSKGDLTIGEIAEILEFNDIYGFSHFFKKEKGVSPTVYAKNKI